jgi:hypothetical protein
MEKLQKSQREATTRLVSLLCVDEYRPACCVISNVLKAYLTSSDTAAARQKHTDAQNDLNRLKMDITSTEGTLNKLQGLEYGREGEWKKLEGTCVEKISGE